MTTAAYPGSFNPPTIAHLAIAEAAHRWAAEHHRPLERLDLVLSRVTLGKESVVVPTIDDRARILSQITATRPWLGVRITDAQLLVDVVDGYDIVVLGADKWAQVIDPVWYGGSEARRDAAVARLPRVLVAPRPPFLLPRPQPGRLDVLEVAPVHAEVSSTAARLGRPEWILPEAVRSGAWSGRAEDR